MTQALVARLHRRAWVRVSGPDWRSFLQGLLTQDVETLEPDQMRYAALLSPQGRLLFDLFLLGEAEGALIDVDAARRDAFVQRLSIYKLRAKVTVETVGGGVYALWNIDTAPAPWVRDPRLPALGFRAFATDAPDGEQADEAAYDRHRLGLGVPDPVLDCPEGGDYPIEADLDLLHAIDFKKGCFVGQETTSRMKRRGAIRSRMLPLRFEGPPPAHGAEVLTEANLRAGEVRSGVEGLAIALLRLDRIEGAKLSVEGRAVEAQIPTWLETVKP